MEKEMETTVVYWGYIGIMEKKMETTIVSRASQKWEVIGTVDIRVIMQEALCRYRHHIEKAFICRFQGAGFIRFQGPDPEPQILQQSNLLRLYGIEELCEL